MTALFPDPMAPSPQVSQYRSRANWRPCSWCGRERNISGKASDACRECQQYEEFATRKEAVT